MHLHDYDVAFRDAKTAISIDEESVEGYLQLGKIHMKLGELRTVLIVFNTYLTEYPNGNHKEMEKEVCVCV